MTPPGLLISAPASGTGKTTLMLGLLSASGAAMAASDCCSGLAECCMQLLDCCV